MRKVRISCAWVHCQCSKSPGWLSLRWYLINYGKHPPESRTRISQVMAHNWHQAAKLWHVITHTVSKINTQIYYGRKQWSQENTVPFGGENHGYISLYYGKHPSECSLSFRILNGQLPAPIFNTVNFDLSYTYRNKPKLNCHIMMAS